MRRPRSQGVQGARERRLTAGRAAYRRLGCLLALFLVGSPALPRAAASPPAGPRVDARAWILLDARDRARLASSHPNQSLAMASTTKLMTAYLALRRLPLAKRLVAPPYHPIPGESLLGLSPGERLSVRDLLYGLLLPSGNDAAATLAAGVAGSSSAFVVEMNRAARRLGLRHTSYANPIGLDQAGNYSSARDLATLALRLRRDPLFRRIVNTLRTTLRTGSHPRTIVNRNDLLARVPWINGVKTGYTLDARNVLVGSGTRKGVTLVSVVMGAPMISARDQDTLALLRYGFSLYRRRKAVTDGEILAHASVANGERGLALIAGRSVRATARRGQRVRLNVRRPDSPQAPIRRGERLGRATVTVDGQRAGSTPLLARYAVGVARSRSLVARVDDAVPGPRALLWVLVAAVAAVGALAIGAAGARRRGK
jgi:serine-type D-Ala-D-Ala carboxypeptidase (penicillin-binding protein 5/6)